MRHAIVVAWIFLSIGAAIAGEPAQRTLTFEDRVAAQRAIEDVYWQHRLWPSDNVAPKPSLDRVMSRASLESRVESYSKKSNALATLWHRPITRDQLQAELDRMARDSREPRLLQEVFDALGNDADLIAETLARPILAERLVRSWSAGEAPDSFDVWWNDRKTGIEPDVNVVARDLVLPSLPASTCNNDTWKPTKTELPDGRMFALAVWTGTEMIVWGGSTEYGTVLRTGSRYNPATDTWVATSTAAEAADGATVVWTGTEMIVWGGSFQGPPTNRGARYDPTNDTWTATSVSANVPAPRVSHTAVWTGSQMIVWGGSTANESDSSIAGRYDPATDTWSPPSTTVNAPGWRTSHTAVWTGTEMLEWGGFDAHGSATNTGGRYDPVADTWTPTGLGANVPAARASHAAVWTGSAMVVWGGRPDVFSGSVNSGGRYDPVTNTWLPTSQGPGVPSPRAQSTTIWAGSRMLVFGGDAPDSAPHAYDPSSDSWQSLATSPLGTRYRHTAVWTGSEMIVWGGGVSGKRPYHTGARYNLQSDSWVMTSMGGVPVERETPAAVWTGTEMIVWGGRVNANLDAGPVLDSGGRYSPATDSWVPTSVTGAPEARQRHASVWTGTEMVVWAGRGTDWLNSGGRYNPMTDTWRPTSVGANVPSRRNDPVVVWSGKEMIVFGDATQTGGRYDPVSDSWKTTAVGPTLNGGGKLAVWSGSEMIVYQGGFGAAGRYNPATDSWLAVPPAPLSKRLDASAIWTGAEMIVWGGGNTTNTGARYDPTTNAWTPTSTGANVATARDAHTATWTGSEMLIWGGSNLNSALDPTRGSRYDPLTDSWQLMSLGPDQPTRRNYHAAVWTGSQLIVWGGQITTATGGVYCACPDGGLFYRDADGDGFGDARLSSPSCDGQTPAGYVTDPSDCNDAAPGIHPGAAESCNGSDDSCDGIVDNGGNALCDDGNVCTDDSCGGATGCAQTNNTAPCSDGQSCTVADVCNGGICVSGAPVICVASDQCHAAGVCDPTTGVCNDPIVSDGTVCNDNDLCTSRETCQGGSCTPAVSGLDEPNPRANGYYKRLCHGPHTGDQLSDSDAACVAQITASFAGISTVAEVCEVIEPSQPNGDMCGRTEDDLMVLALNICRATVCASQRIESQCGSNVSVGQSLAESDAILDSPSRNSDTCSHAKCLDEEINTGRALGMNSLALSRDTGSIRLDWDPPYLSDGAAPPKGYNVWRRVQGSLSPFTKIAETDNPTFLDTTSGDSNLEYEVTAVMK